MFAQTFNTLSETMGLIDPTVCTQISLVVFFLVFLGAFVWTCTRRPAEVKEWSNLPLQAGRDISGRDARGEETL